MMLENLPKVRLGLVAVSRDCFPASLSERRRHALAEAYAGEISRSNLWRLVSCSVRRQQVGAGSACR